jgi:hypothetical protein
LGRIALAADEQDQLWFGSGTSSGANECYSHPMVGRHDFAALDRIGGQVQRHILSGDSPRRLDRPIRQDGADNCGRVGIQRRQDEVEGRLKQVGHLANLAGQVEQVRYDVWH